MSAAEHIDPVTHAARYYAAMAVQAQAVAAHGEYLRSELLEALREDANRLVSTPGYGPRQPRTEVWAVLQDLFASEQGDSILRDMTTLLGQRIKAGDPVALRIAGMVCDEHAAIHQGDAA